MQADNQRLTKKDITCSNIRSVDGIRVPLTSSLTGKTPHSGSLIALRDNNIDDLYYANGQEWLQITTGTSSNTLAEILTNGNITDGNNIVISNGDSITAPNELPVIATGRLVLESGSLGDDSILIRNTNTNSSSGITITAGVSGIDMTTNLGDLILASNKNGATAVQILAVGTNGGIQLVHGTSGVIVGGGIVSHLHTSQLISPNITNAILISGTDMAGIIGGWDASFSGDTTITFGTPYNGNLLSINITPLSSATVTAGIYVSTFSSTSFTVSAVTPIDGLEFSYQVIYIG